MNSLFSVICHFLLFLMVCEINPPKKGSNATHVSLFNFLKKTCTSCFLIVHLAKKQHNALKAIGFNPIQF